MFLLLLSMMLTDSFMFFELYRKIFNIFPVTGDGGDCAEYLKVAIKSPQGVLVARCFHQRQDNQDN